MVEVVPGDQLDDALNRLLAALGVLAVVLPLVGGERLEQREIGFAHRPLQFDGFARVALVVVPRNDPGVLIVGLTGVPGAPRMERKRQPTTISTSAR